MNGRTDKMENGKQTPDMAVAYLADISDKLDMILTAIGEQHELDRFLTQLMGMKNNKDEVKI